MQQHFSKHLTSLYFVLFLGVLFSNQLFSQQELSVEDFKFDGPLGTQGAKIEKIGKNHFKITPGHAPEHQNWSNMLQFQITGHARGNQLRLDVEFPPQDPHYLFNDYFYSWSYDGINWVPIHWKNYQVSIKMSDVLVFPPFTRDVVYFGHQVPISYDQIESFIREWEKSPFVQVNIIGQSLNGRNIYRVTLTDSNSSAKKWVHYFSNQHPGEHNSQWRMAGMLDWLLSDTGKEYLKKSINHFIFMMSPDAPTNGWYRVNAQGVDMNRSYRMQGSDKSEQAHEAYLCQKDLEDLMSSDSPVTDLWCMHTWQGAVETLITPGPEIGTKIGPWTELRDLIIKNDALLLIEPLKTNDFNPETGSRWNHGPHGQFGIHNRALRRRW